MKENVKQKQKVLIDWTTFGMHMGSIRKVFRVPTPTGGTKLGTKIVKGKIPHRNFLTKAEAEALDIYMQEKGIKWHNSTQAQIETGVYGRYTCNCGERGRFFTDWKVSEEILPAQDTNVNFDSPKVRGFKPLGGFKIISEGAAIEDAKVDVSPEAETEGEVVLDSVRKEGIMTTENTEPVAQTLEEEVAEEFDGDVEIVDDQNDELGEDSLYKTE